MIGPDLRSSAFQVLSALAVPENRSARGNMAPVAKAFHNQRPQAIAATGFPQPAATGHCSHRLSTTRTCTQTSGRSHGPRCNAAFQQSSKESSNISRSSSSSTSSPSNAIFAQDGHRPSNHCIKTATRPQAQLKTATGQRDDGHRPSNHGSRSWLGCRDCG